MPKTMQTPELTRIEARIQAIEDAAAAEGRPYSTAEEDELEGLAHDFNAEHARIREEEAEQAAERQRTDKMRHDLLRAAFNHNGAPSDGAEASPPHRMIAAGDPIRTVEKLFGKTPRPGSRKPAEQLRLFLGGHANHGLPPMHAAMGEGVGSLGGVAVPTSTFLATMDTMLQNSVVAQNANVIAQTGKELTWAVFSGSDQSSGLYNFTFQWLSENETVVPDGGLMRGVTFHAHLGGIYVAVSNELLADAPNFEAALSNALGEAMAEAIDFFCLQGSGLARPLGVFNAPGVIEIAKESGQAADTVVLANVSKMLSRSSNPRRAIWVASPSVLPELAQLSYSIISNAPADAGTAALRQSEGGDLSLFGRPLHLSSRATAQLGDAGDIALIDFSNYGLAIREGIGIESSPHPGFTANQTTFRALVRMDGKPLSSSAYTGRDGVTYSSVVTLAERA